MPTSPRPPTKARGVVSATLVAFVATLCIGGAPAVAQQESPSGSAEATSTLATTTPQSVPQATTPQATTPQATAPQNTAPQATAPPAAAGGGTLIDPPAPPASGAPPITNPPVIGPPPVDPAALAELTEKLGTLRAEEAEIGTAQLQVGGEIDVLTIDHTALEAEVRILESELRNSEEALDDAREGVREAQAEAVDAGQRVLAARHEVVVQEEQRDSLLLRAYLTEDDGRGGRDLIKSQTEINDARYRQELIHHHVGTLAEVLEELEALEASAVKAQDAQKEAFARAEVRSQLARTAVEQDRALRRERAILLADIAARLDARLGEAAVLADQGVALADEINTQESRLAGLVAASTGSPVPADVGAARSASIARATAAANFSEGSIVRVRGIRVHEVIADDLEGLLSAAAAEGITFSGWGYRSVASQISLRRQHCGTSDFAIYVQRSSTCSPPTATPGNSMHERGLAVDFTVRGSIISSRSTPEFQWMARNAARFGLFNLPSEPWHWSVNAR